MQGGKVGTSLRRCLSAIGKMHLLALPLTTWTGKMKLVTPSTAERRSSSGAYVHTHSTLRQRSQPEGSRAKPSRHDSAPEDLFPTCPGERKTWNWPRTFWNTLCGSLPKSRPCTVASEGTGRSQSLRKSDNQEEKVVQKEEGERVKELTVSPSQPEGTKAKLNMRLKCRLDLTLTPSLTGKWWPAAQCAIKDGNGRVNKALWNEWL